MDKVLQAIKQQALNNPDIAVLWLYGSRAKGTQRENSDYDLAIAFNDFTLNAMDKTLRPQLLAMDWCEPLGLGENDLSIVDINKVPCYLAEAIIDEGIVIVGNDSKRLYKEMSRIWSMFEYLTFEQKQSQEWL